MSKINVLVVSPDKYGVGKFRIIDPFTYISKTYEDELKIDISYDVPYDDNYFKNYQIVIFHGFIHKINHGINVKRIKWLKDKGIKVIMDTDDYWGIDQRHPMFQQVSRTKFSENRIELLQLSDYVTTTTPIYRNNIINKLNIKNVEVFPNAVNPEEEQFKPNKTDSDVTRFGWLGGSSHLYDLKLMESGIGLTHNTFKNKVQFVLCGFDLRGVVTELDKETGKPVQRPVDPLETVWYKYENIFTKNYKAISEEYKNYLLTFKDTSYDSKNEPYVRRWTKDVSEYATNYNNFDVSLTPLVDSIFNNNKSQLKVIEAGFHKKAIIASDVKPYTIDLVSGKNSLLVPPSKNHKLWGKHMKTYIENPNMIEDYGNELYETVKDKYSLQNVCKNRVEFIKSIINN